MNLPNNAALDDAELGAWLHLLHSVGRGAARRLLAQFGGPQAALDATATQRRAVVDAADATARMRYLVNALSAHEVHVARYYMKRDAYVAATTRVQFALQNYPQTPAIEEGLFILVKAYDALGITDLRDDADRVMRKNYPDSAYLKGTTDTQSQWWKLWK